MCGRYVLVREIKLVEKKFNLKPLEDIASYYSYNISPGQWVPVLANNRSDQLQIFMFGLTPFWAKKKMYLFNARSEGDYNKENKINYNGTKGILTKPAFRKAIRTQRCLVWANAFIEGPQKEKLSKPYVVYCKNRSIFAFAGIWDQWVDQTTGEALRSFSIITTSANTITNKIGHHRSPVIIPDGDEQKWLDPNTPLSDITGLLKTFPDDEMNAFPIAPTIKNPRTEGKDLIQPIGQRLIKEYDFEIEDQVKLFGMGETRSGTKRNEK